MTFNFNSKGIQFQSSGGGGGGGDTVTTDGVQTLTNKTLNAKNNTIEDLGVGNFEDGAVRDSIRSLEEASDDKLVSEKAVAKAVDTFVFDQAIVSDTWVITHNLDKFPSVTVVDSAGTQFLTQVEYNSKNQLTIHMNSATTGKAYLN